MQSLNLRLHSKGAVMMGVLLLFKVWRLTVVQVY